MIRSIVPHIDAIAAHRVFGKDLIAGGRRGLRAGQRGQRRSIQRCQACIEGIGLQECLLQETHFIRAHNRDTGRLQGGQTTLIGCVGRLFVQGQNTNYIRGRVARIYEKDGKLIVKGADTLLGAKPVEIEADMVVLATAGVSNPGAEELAQRLHVSYDSYKFFAEAHPKLKPVETNTAGIFLCGACQAPKDIPETVGMASGAAAKVIGLFSNSELTREPVVAVVNRSAPPVFSTCVGCFMCETACPYNAIEHEEIKGRNGQVIKTVAKVNPGLCQGCGTCVSFCRSKSIDIQGFSNEQMFAEVMALLND